MIDKKMLRKDLRKFLELTNLKKNPKEGIKRYFLAMSTTNFLKDNPIELKELEETLNLLVKSFKV